jgi:hypothetical protein
MSPQAQYDEFGRPLHPVAAAIHNATQESTATPAEQGIASIGPPPDPRDPQYKNSRGRNVLNAILAGFAGISNPRVGYDIGVASRDAKYNRASEAYQNKLAALEQQQKAEAAPLQRGIEKAKLDATYITRQEAADTAAKREEDYRKNIESLSNERLAAIKEKEQQAAKIKQREDDFRRYMEETDAAKKAQALKDFESKYYAPKESIQEKVDTAQKIQEAKDIESLTPTGQAANQSRNVSRITATGTPAALKAEQDAAAARATGTGEAQTTPEMIERKADLKHAESLATVSQQSKNQSEQAQVALQAVPDVRRQIDSASDDLFANRWKAFRTHTLGTEDSTKYAALLTNVDLIQKAVTRIHVGARGSSHILDSFEKLFNVDKMDKKTFTDSFNEVVKWLDRYSKLPDKSGTIDLGDVDKLVESGSSGKYGVIKVNK